jgi:hypothetical protein
MTQPPTDATHLKCRWCPWRVRRWRRLKDGTNRHGYETLRQHVYDTHPREYGAVFDRVEAALLSEPDPEEEDA